jgi:hypothetical protein
MIANKANISASKVDSFNSSHNIGDAVAYQVSENEIKVTRLKSMAFVAGKGHVPFVKLELGRGNFSLDKIKPVEETNKTRNVYKPHSQKLKEHSGLTQLKNHIDNEIKNKNFSIVNKISIVQIFPPIKQKWGIIDETKQFQIWLKSRGFKITSYSTNFYKIQKTK